MISIKLQNTISSKIKLRAKSFNLKNLNVVNFAFYSWYGYQFYFAKNIGLDYGTLSGYYELNYPDNWDLPIITFSDLNSLLNTQQIFFVFKWLSVFNFARTWKFTPAKAISLKRVLVKYYRPLTKPKFIKNFVRFNKFYTFLWRHTWFHKKIKKYKRFSKRFRFGKINYHFFGSLFSKLIIRFLFYYRYLKKYLLNRFATNYPFGQQNQFQKFYFFVITNSVSSYFKVKDTFNLYSIKMISNYQSFDNFLVFKNKNNFLLNSYLNFFKKFIPKRWFNFIFFIKNIKLKKLKFNLQYIF